MDLKSKTESLFSKTWKMPLRESSQRMLKTGYLAGPNLQASLEKHMNRIPVRSPNLKIRYIKAEERWDARFAVTQSKDNHKYHKSLREYFDSQKLTGKTTATWTSINHITSTPSLMKLANKKKPKKKTHIKPWKDVYAPISEFNMTKHPSNRQYF